MIPSGHATGPLRGVALGDESAAAVGTKPAAKSSRSCHRTCRRNLCEIEARPVEQRFAIAAACTDAEVSMIFRHDDLVVEKSQSDARLANAQAEEAAAREVRDIACATADAAEALFPAESSR